MTSFLGTVEAYAGHRAAAAAAAVEDPADTPVLAAARALARCPADPVECLLRP